MPSYALYINSIAKWKCITVSLELDGEWNGVDESIDLEYTEEEQSKVFKHLCEEVPENSYVWGQVWYRQTVK